jgi:hypothetical protein
METTAMHPKLFRIMRAFLSEADGASTQGAGLIRGVPVEIRTPRHRRGAASFDLSESTKQLSEHAQALWIESAMLTHLAKRDATLALHPIALLTRKSVEVCRLAQEIHEMASGRRVRPHRSHRDFPAAVEGREMHREETD